MKPVYRIAFLEDNAFYLKAFYNRVERHAHQLEVYWDCSFQIDAFTDPGKFIVKVEEGMDLVFMDYNLGQGMTAPMLMSLMKAKKVLPSTVIFSENIVKQQDFVDFQQQLKAILRKDNLIVPRSCLLIEEFLLKPEFNA